MYTNPDLTKIYTTADFPLGAKYSANDKAYRFVKYNDGSHTVTGVAGYLAYMCYSGTTTVPNWTVTCDYTSATDVISNYNCGVGFLCAALTDGTYGWIQTAGYNEVAGLTTGNVAAGETIVASGANGTIDGIAAGANHTGRTLGFALADDATTSQAVGTMVITIDTPCA